MKPLPMEVSCMGVGINIFPWPQLKCSYIVQRVFTFSLIKEGAIEKVLQFKTH
jgi:hypothetical protein